MNSKYTLDVAKKNLINKDDFILGFFAGILATNIAKIIKTHLDKK